MTSTDFLLPKPPLGPAEMTIVRWLKRAGESLSAGEPLLVAVNDRVEVAFPASGDGVLDQVLVAEGAAALAGAAVARIAAGAASQAASPNALVSLDREAGQPPAAGPPDPGGAGRSHRISPVARRIAAQAHIDITTLSGSGPSGRILKADVLAALAPAQFGKPSVAAVQGRAPAVAVVQLAEPFALTAMEVDMSNVAAARQRLQAALAPRGPALSDTAIVALAAVEALQRHPLLNAAWYEEWLALRRCVHLGVVGADGARALIRDAQDLNLRGLARLIARPQAGGAAGAGDCTFTLVDLGERPWFATPPLESGQSAALAVGAVRARPVVVSESGGDRVAVRPSALLALAYDARALDHCHADAFLRDVKRRLERFTI